MPDIDPAALSRPDPLSTANPASLSLSKAQAHGIAALPLQKVAKAVNTAQRIDLEPLYTSLKNAIGDNWAAYKESISLFVLGMCTIVPDRVHRPLTAAFFLQVDSTKANFQLESITMSAQMRTLSISTISLSRASTQMLVVTHQSQALRRGFLPTTSRQRSQNRYLEMRQSRD